MTTVSNQDPSFPVAIRLLGGFQLSIEGQPASKLSRKQEWLLALLALARGRSSSRHELMQALWPVSTYDAMKSSYDLQCDAERSSFNFRHALWAVRKTLGTYADCILTPTTRSLVLDRERVWTDVAAFDAAVCGTDPADWVRASDLYEGALLPDCDESWIIAERDTRLQMLMRVLDRLTELARKTGDAEAEIDWLQRTLRAEPLRESVVRTMMRTLACRGEIGEALKCYSNLARCLRANAPNIYPGLETQLLYRELREKSNLQLEEKKKSAVAVTEERSRTGVRRRSKSITPGMPLIETTAREIGIDDVANLLRGIPLVQPAHRAVQESHIEEQQLNDAR